MLAIERLLVQCQIPELIKIYDAWKTLFNFITIVTN